MYKQKTAYEIPFQVNKAKVIERIAALDPAAPRDLAADPLVGGLLVLHDLHPDDVGLRIEVALEEVRPYLASHGGGVQLLGVADGVAHLQLEGACDGCGSWSAGAPPAAA